MNIKKKLYLGFGSVIIFMILLLGIGISELNQLKKGMLEISANQYNDMAIATDVRADLSNIAKGLRDTLLLEDSKAVDKEIASIEKDLDKVNKTLALLPEQDRGSYSQNQINNIVELAKEYSDLTHEFMALVKSGKKSEANGLIMEDGRGIQRDLFQTVEDLNSYQEKEMAESLKSLTESYNLTLNIMIGLALFGLVLGIALAMWITTNLTKGLNLLTNGISNFAEGKNYESIEIPITSNDEIGVVAAAFNEMAQTMHEQNEREKELNKLNEGQTWLKTNVAEITTMLQGINDYKTLSSTFLNHVARLVGATHGAFYIREDNGGETLFSLLGTYAYKKRKNLSNSFRMGEGLVGQSALENTQILLTNVPADYIQINSGLGEAPPQNIMVLPVSFEGKVIAVFELASLKDFEPLQQSLMEEVTANIGIILDSINGRIQLEETLKESQALTEELQVQSEELQSQQDELKRMNEELEEQTEALHHSEEQLRKQQEDLELANRDLHEKTSLLEEQNQQLEEKNKEVMNAKDSLEEKAQQLASSSKYKSEFLANMSHELRTPLNSLLILAKLLSDNKDGNLTAKQIEFAKTIYAAGNDLVQLINEILDLSKVEAGKMTIVNDYVLLEDVKQNVERDFLPVSQQKGIALEINIDPELPSTIYTDGQRLQQILNNLLSNAFKFTEIGKVTLRVHSATQGKNGIAFSVIDTGIGIPVDKQEQIFEAFKQADGTTSRKYGGTGLGLSISREIAHLLGGEIQVSSTIGEGSTFTLTLSEHYQESLQAESLVAASLSVPLHVSSSEQLIVEDDRNNIRVDDKVLLIIEDDPKFSSILLDMARTRNFKGLVTGQGDIGLSMASSYKPDAIILDIQLPVMDGWEVLKALKRNETTSRIPVHIVSVTEKNNKSEELGALTQLEKPVSNESLDQLFGYMESFMEQGMKNLLLVEDDPIQRNSIIELIGDENVIITAVGSASHALEEMKTNSFDCMVMDLGLPDMSGFDLLEKINEDKRHSFSILVYTGRDLTIKEETKLKKYVNTIIIKNVRSPERLLEETALFLHGVERKLPEDKKNASKNLNPNEAIFHNKKILIVDDDIRNVFALSSLLEEHGMNVIFAENGKEGIDLLNKHQDIDLVLMDIMMPEMDGYEAIGEIRSNPLFENLPIIALTAKAMKGDRLKVIEAGASDYIAKPLKNDQLFSLMRVWLYK